MGVAVVTAVAAGLRVRGIGRSLGHDEVFTLVEYASRPWLEILSSYSTPNNHILHSLCVRLAVLLLGEAEWTVRLPALLAGVLTIGLIYHLAISLAGCRHTAVVTSLLTTVSPDRHLVRDHHRPGLVAGKTTSPLHAQECWAVCRGDGSDLLPHRSRVSSSL